ncbi:RNA 3'-terminal phosphate cyclase [Pseudomonas sp. URMO17WK12:I2]|uniref:RNA 3'-terminal phosphate cyclase n=1 Tax=Pseudomonas sp. URMO17WK12:I2 TaxID=1261623 RepID=UPI000DAC8667|nr:RNA 3'-terminal phosphate cyclase [Pseudomonas sp. URMO17WK12:I2]PZW49679.1 RNA 3'-terminal phosphate cyclase (ATP) [Pseudomonas sp. URMO17WK12:I2]
MNKDMLELDGAIGGGQVLRTALSLSMITGTPFRIANIRAKRSRPGLLRQHLTAVLAAAEISRAETEGAEMHATSLVFRPGTIRGGDYRFAIGSAGSCTLVLQTILPALLQAAEASRVQISGGTHNPAAPPFDFLERAWLPLLRRMGGQVELQLHRHGFVPAGGGALEAFIQPSQLMPLHLPERGALIDHRADVLLAGIPGHVGERELARVGKRLQWPDDHLHCTWLDQEYGPGNILMLTVACEQLTEQFCAFGQTSVRAEAVADQTIEPLRKWLASGAAVAEHLADQLLLPMALAGRGSFTTTHLSEHLQSNIQVIEAFCPVAVRCTPTGKALRVEVGVRD